MTDTTIHNMLLVADMPDTFVVDTEIDEAQYNFGHFPEEQYEAQIEEQWSGHMNPLGLVASDLLAAGWDTDNQGAWQHERHGAGLSFLQATKAEAKALNPEPEITNF